MTNLASTMLEICCSLAQLLGMVDKMRSLVADTIQMPALGTHASFDKLASFDD